MIELQQLDSLPAGFLTSTPNSLHSLLTTPTLIHLQGQNTDPLFVSILLHGNEPTGFLAVQQLLKKYQNHELPRSLSIFTGNTLAAAKGLRRLEQQPDYNRVWPGTELADCPETRLMQEIVDIMRERKVFASIDLHNNTGLNPHYACINRKDNRFIQLASLFGRLIVYFIHPKGVQSAAMAELCPAVTLECGKPGQQHGVEHALDYLDTCLHLSGLEDSPVPERQIDIFQTVAQIKARDDISFSFKDRHSDLLLDQELEKMNFTEVAAGTLFGTINHSGQMPLLALDDHGNDVTKKFFAIENSELQLKRTSMPSMLTLDERVIRQDCLCYLMERMSL